MITDKLSLKSPKTSPAGSSALTNRTIFLLLVFTIAVKCLAFRTSFINIGIDAWHTVELTMDYSYGFVRRGLLGSFATLLAKCFRIDYLLAIKTVQFIGVFLFLIAMVLFFRRLLKNESDQAFGFIVLIYIALDNIGLELCMFGLLDTYIIAITILMVFLILKDKALSLIPPLAGICVLIHEGYPMMLFAVIVTLLVYRFCYAEDKKARLRYAVTFVTTGLTVSILFFLSYFVFARLKNVDAEQVIASAWAKLGEEFESSCYTQVFIDPAMVRDRGQMWINGQPQDDFFILMRIVIINIIICSPLIFMTARFWIRIIRNEHIMYRKFLLIFCSLSVFMVLPLIIIHNDQGRWFYDIVLFEIVSISSIALLNLNNEKDILTEMTKLTVPKMLMFIFYTAFFFVNTGYELNYISMNLVRIYSLFFNI